MLEGLCVSVFFCMKVRGHLQTIIPGAGTSSNWLKNTDTVWILAGRLLGPLGYSGTLRLICLFYSIPIIFLHSKLLGILSTNEHNIQPTEPKKDVF